MTNQRIYIFTIIFFILLGFLSSVHADDEISIHDQRLALYKKTETLTQNLEILEHLERGIAIDFDNVTTKLFIEKI